jgi:hypothetical protein
VGISQSSIFISQNNPGISQKFKLISQNNPGISQSSNLSAKATRVSAKLATLQPFLI